MTAQYPSSTEVRDWAMTKSAGRNVRRVGKLPREVIEGWDRAHPDRPYVAGQSFHGTVAGYQGFGCRCERCLIAGHINDANIYQAAKELS